MFTRGDLFYVHRGTVILDELLEQRVRVFQFLLHFLPVLLGVFTEQGQGALVLARVQLFEIDVVFFQEAVEVGDLGQHAYGADDGKRGGDDPVGHAGHHVSAAGGDLVHRHGQLDAAIADALQLGCGQAIAVHGTAAALQHDQNLVLVIRDREQGADLLAQRGDVGGPDVALEVKHEDPVPAVTAL